MPKLNKSIWVEPRLTVYGDMGTLTQGTVECKVRGLADDLANTISDFPIPPGGICPDPD